MNQSPYVVAVCRSHLPGLRRAQDVAAQFAAGLVPPGVQLLGLVTVADAPGRLPPAARKFRALVAGGAYARSWHVPWIPEWRLGATSESGLPPSVTGLAQQLAELVGLQR